MSNRSLFDYYVIANKVAPDVVLSHDSAVYALGYSYNVFSNRITYYSERPVDPFTFQGTTYTQIPYPSAVIAQNAQFFNTQQHYGTIRVTQDERTMVDILSHPDISGGWEMIWRALENIDKYNIDVVLQYLEILDNAPSYSIVGLFLEQYKSELSIEEDFLELLEHKKPLNPEYIYHSEFDTCVLAKRWNLIVPEEIITHSWDEFSQFAGMETHV